MEKYTSMGTVNELEEFLDSSRAREQLRVAAVSKPFYSGESVAQAVSEFEKKIASVKISHSIKKASADGDIEMLNRLIREKQDLEFKSKGV